MTEPRTAFPARRRRIATIGITAAIVLGGGAALAGQLLSDEPPAPTASPSTATPTTAPPTAAAPTAAPAPTIDAPGYDPDPGPFSLTPLADASADLVVTELAYDADATRSEHALGFSFEATELASPMWGSADSNLEPMLAALDRPILRFGGQLVDRRMWWTSSDEPAPEWARATVTPADLERVAATAESVDAQVTIALDLGHDDPERAADMAGHVQRIFGDRLLAVSIGNEPNGFHYPDDAERSIRDGSWGTGAYQESLRTYADAFEQEAPGVPIAGPGAYDAAWWRAFTETELPTTEALSMHWYPLYSCAGADAHAAATIENLTSPLMRERAQSFIGRGVEAADELGLPLWVEETGHTSCSGGNETTRTHAQAVWTADFALTLQETGAERIALHSTLQACQGGAPMSPVCATGTAEAPGELVMGRANFLAMMQVGWLPDGQVLTPSAGGDGRVFVHGVLGDDGSLALLVIDLRDPAGGEGAAPVEVAAPSGLPDGAPSTWTLAEGSRLSADSWADTVSSLGAPAPVIGAFADAPLSTDRPLTITSEPGSTTLLTFAPAAP